MNSVTFTAAAKINLSLDITGRRADGYHLLDSVFQTVSVYDTITLETCDTPGIFLTCDAPGIPCDGRNLAYRAAAAFLETAGIQTGVRIRLGKGIPSQAGMGGGSADAAGVLWGLDRLLGTGMTNAQLREIGVKLGADVPFLLLGGTARAQGVGEQLTPLRTLPALPLVIVKGEQSVSTPEAYRLIDGLTDPRHPDTQGMLSAIEAQDIPALCRCCGNLFEQAVSLTDITRAREALAAQGAVCAVLTGSGSAVFGIFTSDAEAVRCARALARDFAFVQACRTVGTPFALTS